MIKSRDVQVCPIGIDTLVMRSRTWERLKFEIEYGLQRGTTANSYVIQGDKIALFDPPGESFTEIFLNALKQRIEPTTIDYVILGHVNPNRGETIKALLKIAPQITIVCSNPGALLLPNILLPQFPNNLKVVKGEDILDLGQGHQLQFIPTPNPRYPAQLCTYDPKTEILYTDKLFGSHVCGDQIFDEGWKVYAEDRRYYFDCLIAPYGKQISTALE
ncbi:MAG: FprA family A-type flavoprotein, partial [Crocosphaera sp.]